MSRADYETTKVLNDLFDKLKRVTNYFLRSNS